MRSPGGLHRRGRVWAVAASRRAYRVLMRAYPSDIRERYGEEMVGCFSDACRDAVRNSGPRGLAAVWLRTLPELLYTALKERSTTLDGNVYRSVGGVALATAFILLLPLLAMQITDEVVWGLFDFAFAGALIFGTGLTYVLAARKRGNIAYRFAVGVALAAAFILVWMNVAVGIIGSEDDLANSMYVGVLAVGVIGALFARFRPHGMARALFATALAQALVAGIALSFGFGSPWSPPVEILALNGVFVGLFVGSALLFRHAAREQIPMGAGPEG